jgi:hypothetical protein
MLDSSPRAPRSSIRTNHKPAMESTIPENSLDSEKLDYQIIVEPADGYLLIRIAGTRTKQAASVMIADVIRAATGHQQGRLLIDVRELAGLLNVVETYYLVRDDFLKPAGAGLQRVAILDRQVPDLREWFMEQTARNRGYDLRIFAGRQEALDWLLSSAAAPHQAG